MSISYLFGPYLIRSFLCQCPEVNLCKPKGDLFLARQRKQSRTDFAAERCTIWNPSVVSQAAQPVRDCPLRAKGELTHFVEVLDGSKYFHVTKSDKFPKNKLAVVFFQVLSQLLVQQCLQFRGSLVFVSLPQCKYIIIFIDLQSLFAVVCLIQTILFCSASSLSSSSSLF